MKRKISILILAAALNSGAETADEWFNKTAREYIYSHTAEASNLVYQALADYPGDEKLLKLKELIEQQQEQQQQNQDQQNNENQNDQSDSSDRTDQQQDQSGQEEQQKEENSQEHEEPAEQNPAKEQPAERQPGEMSEEEAMQLLDAMKQNEQDRRANLHPYLGPPVRVEKDW
ncbi:MAG: hypothetical protein WC959_04910 [Kiritimatiellales bacterium]